MPLLTPDLMVKNVTCIEEEMLRSRGIRGLILDVDNTLTDHGSQILRPSVETWLLRMKKSGMKMTIVSNNTHERVEPFANKLGLGFISMGCKPLTVGMTRAQKKLGLNPSQIAVVGDQIFTDIIGGNLKGMFTIMVEPFVLEQGLLFRIKRGLEAFPVRRYQKRQGKRPGSPDANSRF